MLRNAHRYVGTLALALVFAKTVAGAIHQPEAPAYLRERVAREARQGLHPVVILDLDDTLVDTRTRTRRILKTFAARSSTVASYPREAQILSRATLADIRYHLRDTLDGLHLTDASFREKAKVYWEAAFFSDELCALDGFVPGAAEYTRSLHGVGAHVVYLSGRDAPRMGRGTELSLRTAGFPLGRRATLMLKPDATEDDVVFKTRAFQAIARLGTVSGGIDNEPANVNAMKTAFPRASVLFIDTRHSGKPVEPMPTIPWFRGYTR